MADETAASEVEAPADARDSSVDLAAARAYLLDLQGRVCSAVGALDPALVWREDELPGERGGLARPRVGGDGAVFERAAVHFSHTVGEKLPAAATERLRELAGESFEAVSISLILHPVNPYVPTTHANLRCFAAGPRPVWWLGGGFDLTPYYGFEEDARHWHRTARAACEPFGDDVYPRYKRACDEYFYLPHRDEARGVGGLFFDDLREPSFAECFAFLRSVGDHFLPAYLPIVERRKDTPWGERERAFQLYRRGRYVEFNLLYDRGTRFGLQARGRVESILASLPPLVRWTYEHQAEPGSPEARLVEDFLRPRDWLGAV